MATSLPVTRGATGVSRSRSKQNPAYLSPTDSTMHNRQRRSMIGRTLLATIALFTMAACDRSGNPLAPVGLDRSAVPGDVMATKTASHSRPAMPRGTPMTREEARKKGIEVARAALTLARSGATTGLSDGRQLTGSDAVLHWERTLHALETGSSPLSVWPTAGSSSGTASASMASVDDPGYVAGGTQAGRVGWESAQAHAYTLGSSADYTYTEGTLTVELVGKNGVFQEYRTRSTGYYSFSNGDETWATAQIDWDYNWQFVYGLATTKHVAGYASSEAWTTSSASI